MKTENNFTVHGFYTVSNAGGFEIELSNCGDMARVRDCYGSGNSKVSDWLDIVYVTQSNEDAEDGQDVAAIIDPLGYSIPLSLVMRANR